jgi:hypothetical protein
MAGPIVGARRQEEQPAKCASPTVCAPWRPECRDLDRRKCPGLAAAIRREIVASSVGTNPGSRRAGPGAPRLAPRELRQQPARSPGSGHHVAGKCGIAFAGCPDAHPFEGLRVAGDDRAASASVARKRFRIGLFCGSSVMGSYLYYNFGGRLKFPPLIRIVDFCQSKLGPKLEPKLGPKLGHRMTAGGRFGAAQQGGNHRAAASALSSGIVLKAMAAAGAALCTALTTASNSASP